MLSRSAAPLALMLVSCCAAAEQPKEASPVRIQFAFYHFDDDHVRVTVNGETAFDRAVSVSPDNARNGLAAVAQIELPECADIVVTTKRQRAAERICIDAQTRSIVIDGEPSLTIAAKDRFQGED